MAKFNSKSTGAARATSYEGAELYEKELEQDWVNFLFSSMLSNKFYESDQKQMD